MVVSSETQKVFEQVSDGVDSRDQNDEEGSPGRDWSGSCCLRTAGMRHREEGSARQGSPGKPSSTCDWQGHLAGAKVLQGKQRRCSRWGWDNWDSSQSLGLGW